MFHVESREMKSAYFLHANFVFERIYYTVPAPFAVASMSLFAKALEGGALFRMHPLIHCLKNNIESLEISQHFY